MSAHNDGRSARSASTALFFSEVSSTHPSELPHQQQNIDLDDFDGIDASQNDHIIAMSLQEEYDCEAMWLAQGNDIKVNGEVAITQKVKVELARDLTPIKIEPEEEEMSTEAPGGNDIMIHEILLYLKRGVAKKISHTVLINKKKDIAISIAAATVHQLTWRWKQRTSIEYPETMRSGP